YSQSGSITRVYFVEGLGHNLFLVGQFCDSDLEVAFRRNSCFVRSLEGVDLLKGNRSTNLYTIESTPVLSQNRCTLPIFQNVRRTSGKLWEHTMMRSDHQDPNALDNMKPWKRYCSHKFIMSSCYAKSRYNTRLAQLLPRHVYSPCVVNWDVLNRMGCDGEIDDMLRIRLREAESNEEIFTSVVWIRAFNINEPIYAKLCHEFYSTYEFYEVCADDELQTKRIIKFRLGRRAHNLTLLEFARRLGLHHADELEKDGFNVYFEGALYSDEHFNAQEYWMTEYDKIQKNDLWLLIMFDARHQNGYANVAWLIARKSRVLTNDVIRSLSAPIYCRDLDTTSLRDLIDSEGKLIPEDPQLGVPRVGIPRPPRASMQDLYDSMGRIEIRQEAIDRMEYRQSYH
ncbi:hypothetical protein Tco_0765571, partial [Tanacetum coccineum]